MHDDDRIAAAYGWGLEESARPRTDDVQREQLERLLTMSRAELGAAMRGLRDGRPASAPLPLPFRLAVHVVWLVLLSEAHDRGGRWYHYAAVAPALYGFMKLSFEAEERTGPARARAAGIERQADAPRPVRTRTSLWLGLMVPVTIGRRLAGHRPRAKTIAEMGATTLAADLVTWWAWRPHLRRAAPRA